MISLSRGATIPQKLLDDGDRETRALITAFENSEAIEPKSSVYGHSSVKTALNELQNNKCAFCETKLTQQFGNVEHFRPKKRYQAKRGETPVKPGYFWLAYDWGNLTLSCEVCNIRFKRDYFPLKDDDQRASPAIRNVSAEEPLLIDPFQKMPSDFIAFDGWNILAIDDNGVGHTTIEGFGLNSTELDESRGDRYRSVRSVLEMVEQLKLNGGNIPRTAIQFLDTAINAKGEYAAMIRGNFEERINQAIA